MAGRAGRAGPANWRAGGAPTGGRALAGWWRNVGTHLLLRSAGRARVRANDIATNSFRPDVLLAVGIRGLRAELRRRRLCNDTNWPTRAAGAKRSDKRSPSPSQEWNFNLQFVRLILALKHWESFNTQNFH